MKTRLKMAISALVWAVAPMAAYAVAAQAQTGPTHTPRQTGTDNSIQLNGTNPAVTGSGTAGRKNA